MMSTLHQLLGQGPLVKAIAGISNLNTAHVLSVVKAAVQAGVGAVDVAADAALITTVKAEIGQAPVLIFASSVVPAALAAAAQAGADVLELGNYDALYATNAFFTAQDVLTLAEETLALVGHSVPLCVTVPGHLSRSSQQALAVALEAMGVALLQSEGAVRLLEAEAKVSPLATEEKAQVSLQNVVALTQACGLPVMAASGMSATTVAAAVEAGACAVGIGSAINQFQQVAPMVAQLEAINQALATAGSMSLAQAV
jgi:hypothetical protein